MPLRPVASKSSSAGERGPSANPGRSRATKRRAPGVTNDSRIPETRTRLVEFGPRHERRDGGFLSDVAIDHEPTGGNMGLKFGLDHPGQTFVKHDHLEHIAD